MKSDILRHLKDRKFSEERYTKTTIRLEILAPFLESWFGVALSTAQLESSLTMATKPPGSATKKKRTRSPPPPIAGRPALVPLADVPVPALAPEGFAVVAVPDTQALRRWVVR